MISEISTTGATMLARHRGDEAWTGGEVRMIQGEYLFCIARAAFQRVGKHLVAVAVPLRLHSRHSQTACVVWSCMRMRFTAGERRSRTHASE